MKQWLTIWGLWEVLQIVRDSAIREDLWVAIYDRVGKRRDQMYLIARIDFDLFSDFDDSEFPCC